MKGIQFIFTLILHFIFFMALTLPVSAQQNNTLFFMHNLPEANYVNPAVQINCGIFLGLPVVSSFHFNYANSGFPAGKIVTIYTDNTFSRRTEMSTSGMMPKNYLLTELHSVLLAVGVKRNDFYYSFTITEKNNGEIIYTPDFIEFFLRGSQNFEGQQIQLDGLRFTMDHLREYALGISHKYNTRLTFGLKFKVLFGKFNFTTGSSNLGISVEPTTRNLLFDLGAGYNSSLPYGLVQTAPGVYDWQEIYPESWFKRMMNMNNPGLALDMGFIYKYSDDWSFSGSLLDLGFLWYRSNLNTYSINGSDLYTGQFGLNRWDNRYFRPMFNEWNTNMNARLTAESYTYFLRPRLYLGASRKLNDRYDINFLLYNRLLPSKLQTGATVSVLTRADKAFRTSLSWSYMNHSPLNLGLGFSYGRRPVQIYFITDNLVGFIVPLSVKNINARFGLNINLGCKNDFDINDCGCSWMRNESSRRERKREMRK
ncbi:MAG TPA: DUF5723 family protein [Bacteroidales bacterium]|nr:DUF5723 family protein [Bacteroidales bacterium]